MQHIPVLLQEVLKYLDPKPGEFVIDGTIDGGGHAAEILKRILPGGKLLGVDWDEKMLARCEERIANSPSAALVHGNYAEIPEILAERKLPKADGLLLDLGFSSEQLEGLGGGFSFGKDEPLVMTYDREATPVAELLRTLRESELAKIIAEFGEERFAKRIARAIKEAGKKKRIMTTGELREVIERAVPKNYERGRIHPATRTFQALRIYANNELENLKELLARLPEVLARGGRAVIVSFHSLEDRIVKNYFKKFEAEGKIKILTKKPVTASAEEKEKNPRSRSAKMRVAILI